MKSNLGCNTYSSDLVCDNHTCINDEFGPKGCIIMIVNSRIFLKWLLIYWPLVYQNTNVGTHNVVYKICTSFYGRDPVHLLRCNFKLRTHFVKTKIELYVLIIVFLKRGSKKPLWVSIELRNKKMKHCIAAIWYTVVLTTVYHIAAIKQLNSLVINAVSRNYWFHVMCKKLINTYLAP